MFEFFPVGVTQTIFKRKTTFIGQLHIEMRKEKIAAKTEGSDVHSSNEQS